MRGTEGAQKEMSVRGRKGGREGDECVERNKRRKVGIGKNIDKRMR